MAVQGSKVDVFGSDTAAATATAATMMAYLKKLDSTKLSGGAHPRRRQALGLLPPRGAVNSRFDPKSGRAELLPIHSCLALP